MENKDLLKILNSINYSDTEIEELENISIEKIKRKKISLFVQKFI